MKGKQIPCLVRTRTCKEWEVGSDVFHTVMLCVWGSHPGVSEPVCRLAGLPECTFIFTAPCAHICFLVAGIDLENIVYYKDDTHYFVMTAKKQSLLDKGVIVHVSNGFLSSLLQVVLMCSPRENFIVWWVFPSRECRWAPNSSPEDMCSSNVF